MSTAAERLPTLEQIAHALAVAAPDDIAIIDRTLYTGVQPGYRTIELRRSGWSGPVIGGFGEYPEGTHRWRFTPDGTQTYGLMEPIVRALRAIDVAVDREGMEIAPETELERAAARG